MLLLEVLAWAWRVSLWTKIVANEALDPGCEASVRLHKLYSKLVQAETLQRFRTLLVSLDLVKAIGHIVTPGACPKHSLEKRRIVLTWRVAFLVSLVHVAEGLIRGGSAARRDIKGLAGLPHELVPADSVILASLARTAYLSLKRRSTMHHKDSDHSLFEMHVLLTCCRVLSIGC